jgi:hypothetical protein
VVVEVDLAVLAHAADRQLRLVRRPELAGKNDVQLRAKLTGKDGAGYDPATGDGQDDGVTQRTPLQTLGKLVSTVFTIAKHGKILMRVSGYPWLVDGVLQPSAGVKQEAPPALEHCGASQPDR